MCQMLRDNEKEYYLLHAKMNAYKKKVEKAIFIAKEALKDAKNPLTSFSGGKDSIVMLDILIKAGFCGELVFFKYGLCTDKETPHETIDIVEYYANKFELKLNVIRCLGEIDCWDKLGYFCLFPETDEEKRVFNETNNDYRKKAIEFENNYGCDMSFIGMKKSESKQRRITLLKHGSIYKTKGRNSITCCPLLNFTGPDIWAYIFSNKLRYPSFYDYPYESRELIRNEPTLLYSDSVIRYGHVQTIKALFPEYITEIKTKYQDAII